MLEAFLSKTIPDIDLPGLSAPYKGKVRNSYDVDAGRKLIVATDRLSAFDRQIAPVPLKGQVLTQLARFWFDHTGDICPNHVIAYPDPNVLICKKLKMLPVELVVRGYLAGSTSTSILSMYKAGKRDMYGYHFAEGMRDNQKLPEPIVTPTSKGDLGTHDEPLTAAQIVESGLIPKEIWDKVSGYAVALFKRGQEMAAKRGLILADTKYEFGMTDDGVLTLGDEIHTPDSSRYWVADTYPALFAEGKAPQTLDKDVMRRWVKDHCDPYKDEVLPAIPAEVIKATAQTYIAAYEQMTGMPFDYPDVDSDPIVRIKTAVATYLKNNG